MSALRIPFLSVSLPFCTPVNAVERCVFHGVQVEDFAGLWRESWTLLQLKLANLPSFTGCAPAAPAGAHGIVSDWANSAYSGDWSFRLALIKSAFAQHFHVDIQVKDHARNNNATRISCNASAGLG